MFCTDVQAKLQLSDDALGIGPLLDVFEASGKDSRSKSPGTDTLPTLTPDGVTELFTDALCAMGIPEDTAIPLARGVSQILAPPQYMPADATVALHDFAVGCLIIAGTAAGFDEACDKERSTATILALEGSGKEQAVHPTLPPGPLAARREAGLAPDSRRRAPS